jgi:hypothetical protein
LSNAAPHTIPAADRPEPDYAARRAARVNKRQEKEAKRQYESLKGTLRSQLRRQIDQIMNESAKDLVFALLNGARLQVSVKVEMPEAEAPAVETPPPAPEPKSLGRRLIEVVRS